MRLTIKQKFTTEDREIFIRIIENYRVSDNDDDHMIIHYVSSLDDAYNDIMVFNKLTLDEGSKFVKFISSYDLINLIENITFDFNN